MLRQAKTLVLLLAASIISGCTSYSLTDPVSESDIAQLTQSIRALGPEVDADEAARAARIAYEYPRQLAVQYGIVDPPLMHNVKVNRGTRPRGLCYHWADDLETRLRQEGFTTLILHRAIANSKNPIIIEHSTVIISRPGDTFEQGVVLDPWRHGGLLYWAPTLQDEKYTWLLRADVFANKRRLQEARARHASGG